MASVNKVIIVGNLGSDPEFKTIGEGEVCNFTVATNESWNDKQGNKQERVEWHKIVVWGKQAKPCSQYLTKGRPVYVEGKIQTRHYEKDGAKVYITEIYASDVKFLGAKPGEKDDSPSSSSRPSGRNNDSF